MIVRIAVHTTLLLLVFAPAHAGNFQTAEDIGSALFFEVGLSENQTQSCASCHMPGLGFIDARKVLADGAASLGANGTHGRRNTPTLSYIGETPSPGINDEGIPLGGFFYDGRAPTLSEQAEGPIFSPVEMALSSKEVLFERYSVGVFAEGFKRIYGEESVSSPDRLLEAITDSLAAFQRSHFLAPYNSKYDKFLRGEVTLSKEEEHGRLLFFSTLINCNSCHQLDQDQARETFTDYTFHNIGVPANPDLKLPSPDFGLAENPHVDQPDQHRGKFKVPTLRNVVITGPYMHNGVFQDLETVMAFYNKYLMIAPVNPETGKDWDEPEVPENISNDLLRQGQPLDEYRVEAIIAFLKTLTDEQFEHLLD